MSSPNNDKRRGINDVSRQSNRLSLQSGPSEDMGQPLSPTGASKDKSRLLGMMSEHNSREAEIANVQYQREKLNQSQQSQLGPDVFDKTTVNQVETASEKGSTKAKTKKHKKNVKSQRSGDGDFPLLNSKQQKEVIDDELDEIELKLLKKLKRNKQYMNPEMFTKDQKQHIETASVQSITTQSQRSLTTNQSNSIPAKFNKKLNSKNKRLTALEAMEERLEKELEDSQLRSKKDRLEQMESGYNVMKEKKQRKWLIKHGKGHVLQFTDEEIRKLKECFNQLDEDGGGSIGVDELEEPLIGLGLADTKEEVEAMILAVDDDGSGQIEFEEFLGIIQNSEDGEASAKINKFFKDMSNGEIGNKNLSFGINVQDIRRKLMMTAILSKGDEKEGGMRILNNVKTQLQASKTAEKEDDMDVTSNDKN